MQLLKYIAIGVLGTSILIVCFWLAAELVWPLSSERSFLAGVLYLVLACVLAWLFIEKFLGYFYYGYSKNQGSVSHSNRQHEREQANRRVWIVVAIATAVPISILYYLKPITIFGLAGHHTVYEFQTASLEHRVRWSMRMCDDGECLLKEDRACGFTLYDMHGEALDMVSTCFYAELKRSNAWTRLDSLRKRCGRRYMTFDANFPAANPDLNSQLSSRCKELVGDWGKPRRPIQ